MEFQSEELVERVEYNYIDIRDIEKEIEIIQPILDSNKIISKNIKRQIEKLGYKFAILGTGKDSLIHSKELKIMELNNRKYLSGRFFAIGVYALGKNGKNVTYRGYVKKILE